MAAAEQLSIAPEPLTENRPLKDRDEVAGGIAACLDRITDAAAPKDRMNFQGLFAPSWETSISNDQKELYGPLVRARKKIAGLANALRAGEPLTSKDGLLMWQEEAGEQNASLEDLLMALEAINDKEGLAFLKQHINVRLGGQEMAYSVFEKIVLGDVQKNPQYADMSEEQKLAAREQTKEKLSPQYQLVCAGGPAGEEANLAKEQDESRRALLARVLGIKPGQMEQFNALFSQLQTGAIKTYQEFTARARQFKQEKPDAKDQKQALEDLYKETTGEAPSSELMAKPNVALQTILRGLGLEDEAKDLEKVKNDPSFWDKLKKRKPSFIQLLIALLFSTTSIVNAADNASNISKA